MFKKMIKSSGLVAGCAALAACGTLLWEVTYQIDQPTISSVLATDAEKNIYVGGGKRISVNYILDQDYNAILLKYDDDGGLLWEIEFPQSSVIKNVTPLGDGSLLVATDSNASTTWSNEEKVSELWKISSSNGQLQQKITTFEDEGFEGAYVSSDGFYISKSTENRFNICMLFCSDTDSHSTVSSYDLNGEFISSTTYDSEISSLDISNSGDVYVGLSSSTVYKYNADLSLQWFIDPNSQPEFSCGYLIDIKTDSNDAVWIHCYDRLQKVSSDGLMMASASLDSFLEEKLDGNGDVVDAEMWSLPLVAADKSTMLIADSNDDIYVTKTRITILGTNNDPRPLGGTALTQASAVAADAVIIKISGETGDILWSDDVNSLLFGTENGFSAYYYYPLGLAINSNNEALFSFRGFKGHYVGYYELHGDSFCANADDMFFILNMCTRDEIQDVYAKTLKYNTTTGERISETRHNIEYPRDAILNSEDELIVTGDNAFDVINRQAELITLGIGINDDAPFTENSHISLQKHKF